jgi:opacity protein-like surface antigen
MKNLFFGAVLLVFAQIAFAGCACESGSNDCASSGTLNRDHLYVGVGGGVTTRKDPVTSSHTGVTKIDIGSRAHETAYEFNYHQVGTTGSINNVDHYGVSFLAFLRKPSRCEYDDEVEIVPTLNFFGRLGYGFATTKFASGSSTSSKGFYFGVGLEYELFENFSVRAEVSKFNRADTTPAVTESVVTQTASLVYHF